MCLESYLDPSPVEAGNDLHMILNFNFRFPVEVRVFSEILTVLDVDTTSMPFLMSRLWTRVGESGSAPSETVRPLMSWGLIMKSSKFSASLKSQGYRLDSEHLANRLEILEGLRSPFEQLIKMTCIV